MSLSSVTSEKPARNLLCYSVKLGVGGWGGNKTKPNKPQHFLLVREQQKKKIRFANSSSLTETGADLELAVFCPW